MTKEQPSYYAIIPAFIRYDKNLSPNEKLLYGEITALTNKSGYCFASNSYFSDLYAVHKNTVSKWISNLEKQGYIQTQIIKNQNKQIEQRRIFLSTPINEKVKTPINEKVKTPINEKVKDNNTSFNTTSLNTTSDNKENAPIGAKNEPKDINKELTMDDKPESVDVNVWFSFLKHRKSKKSKLTELAMKGIIRESAKAGIALEEVLIMIMERGWQSFKAEWVNKQGYNQQSNHSQASRHTGFDEKDYTNGLIEQEDGTYAF